MRPGFEFNWKFVADRWEWLASGLLVNLGITAGAMLLALVFGLFIALMRMSRVGALNALGRWYVNVFRAIPLYIFIIWLYYGLPMFIGVNFDPIVAGMSCLALQYAGWLAEIYRSGIGAIGKGQREAALSLGLSPVQTFRDVVFPQALRIIIPPIGNNFVGMLKDSSLVAIIGVFEITRQAQLAVSDTFRPFEFYTTVAVVFIVLTQVLSHGVGLLERRLRG
jgi:His/Glu/Gln/Arg/opine family amino acid ABC transporter permease subunit